MGEGSVLLLWGSLPAIFFYIRLGDFNPLAQLIGTFVLAGVLRQTVSLALTTLIAVPMGILFAFLLVLLSPSMIDQFVAFFSDFISTLKEQVENAGQIMLPDPPGEKLVIGLIGVANTAAVILCLFLARYWQAALYNPKGFGVEFRALRYSAVIAFPLAIGFSLVSGIDNYQSWAGFFGLPLTVSGLALVHAKAQTWSSRGTGLFLFYLVWVIIDLAKLILILLAVIDSVYDFRKNWAKANVLTERKKDNESNDS